jgi:hypothetical protein
MRTLLLILAVALLASCQEKPQRMEQSSEQAAASDQGNDARRQRTLGQSESDRIYQQGMLR